MKLGVTVATYRRPKGLDRLLSSIAEAEVPKGAELLVVVVDNDPEGSSRDIVDQYASLLETHYEIEPERGIPFVRNRGVRAALDLGATHILFVDDDERVDEQWLVGIASARARPYSKQVQAASEAWASRQPAKVGPGSSSPRGL